MKPDRRKILLNVNPLLKDEGLVCLPFQAGAGLVYKAMKSAGCFVTEGATLSEAFCPIPVVPESGCFAITDTAVDTSGNACTGPVPDKPRITTSILVPWIVASWQGLGSSSSPRARTWKL